MRRPYILAGLLLLAAIGFAVYWFIIRPRSDATSTGPITAATQDDFSHLAEGSEIFPIDWLHATTSIRTGKQFLDNLDRFGLYDDPNGPPIPGENNKHLPVGLTLARPIGSEMEMLGVNCSACHSTIVQFQGTKIRIDGAPNTFDITEFYTDIFLSAEATVMDPQKLLVFLRTLKAQVPRDPPSRLLVSLLPYLEKADRDPNSFPGLLLKYLQSLFQPGVTVPRAEADKLSAMYTEPTAEGRKILEADLAKLRAGKPLWKALKDSFEVAKSAAAELRDLPPETLPMLEARFAFLKKIKHQQALSDGLPKPGPGRADAFADARIFLFSDADARPPSAPVRYPAIWSLSNRHWVHWDGNTNSISERNAGQALGLGALADTATFKSTLLPVNLYRLEDYARKLQPPAWPKEFGPVDTASAAFVQGKQLYAQNCASCHEGQEKRETADLPNGKGKKILANGKVLVFLIGTDDARQVNFATPLSNGKEFASELGSLQRKIKDQAIADAATELARPGIKEIKEAMDALDVNPEWLTNRGYIARPLAGTWATAPFLHNGSVPSIAELLKPAKDRPKKFWVGSREYDPATLGYFFEKAKIPADQQPYIRELDTAAQGNSKAGHEFGTTLSDDEKRALILYLKGLKADDFKPQ